MCFRVSQVVVFSRPRAVVPPFKSVVILTQAPRTRTNRTTPQWTFWLHSTPRWSLRAGLPLVTCRCSRASLLSNASVSKISGTQSALNFFLRCRRYCFSMLQSSLINISFTPKTLLEFLIKQSPQDVCFSVSVLFREWFLQQLMWNHFPVSFSMSVSLGAHLRPDPR